MRLLYTSDIYLLLEGTVWVLLLFCGMKPGNCCALLFGPTSKMVKQVLKKYLRVHILRILSRTCSSSTAVFCSSAVNMLYP